MDSEYDAFGKEFSKTRNRSWFEFPMLFEYIHKHDRVLDLGCGNARLRRFLEKEKLPEGQYYGLDLSEQLLSIARETFPHDHFFKGDFSQKLVFGADNFDVVTAIASFHHLLSKKDQRQFFGECARVLKKGGILFISTWKIPNKYSFPNLIRGRFKNWIVPFGPQKLPRTYRRVNASELRNLAQKSEFQVLKAELVNNRNFILVAKKK